MRLSDFLQDWDKARLSTLINSIQQSIGDPSQCNKIMKRNERNTGWKGRSKTLYSQMILSCT